MRIINYLISTFLGRGRGPVWAAGWFFPETMFCLAMSLHSYKLPLTLSFNSWCSLLWPSPPWHREVFNYLRHIQTEFSHDLGLLVLSSQHLHILWIVTGKAGCSLLGLQNGPLWCSLLAQISFCFVFVCFFRLHRYVSLITLKLLTLSFL